MGKRLLNGGSAFIFFSINKLRYLYLLGVEGVCKDVGWGKGFTMFLQLAIVRAFAGLAFGLDKRALLFILKCSL